MGLPTEIEVQAAVAHARDQPFTTTVLMLKAPSADEIRVRIVATGICHTDVMNKTNGLCTFPMVLGHEGVGIVDTVGSNVTNVEPGDHVILSYDACGDCPQCMRHKPSYCDSHGSLNFAGTRPNGELTHRSPDSDVPDVHGSYFQQSSFATYALSHESNTIKVDKSLPLEQLAPLGCGVQTGAGTVLNTLKVEPESSVAVYGCGCVGLSAVMAARIANAATIIAIDINSKRLEMAKEFGATHCINPNDLEQPAELVSRVRRYSQASGVNYAIDTTGLPAVLRQAFDSCGPMGTTAMIAPNVPGTEITVETLGLLPGKSLRGVVQGDSVPKEFIPKLIKLWQQGQFPFDRMIARFEGLHTLEDAVKAMEAGHAIKPVVIVDPAFNNN